MIDFRPKSLQDYVGQKAVIKTLSLFLEAVKNRGYSSEHILFYGPPGIGKTTLSHIISHELKGTLKITSGAALQKGGDLAAILTNLKDNDVFFIDEIHRMPKHVEELLYPVLEDYALDIIVGKGPSARTVRLPVPKITIIGATTKLALISAPLRDRFGLLLRLDFYTEEEMARIIEGNCQNMDVSISRTAALQIAKRSRNTPRIANRLLKRARDIIEIRREDHINDEIIQELFSMLNIDKAGLTDIDVQYLHVIYERYQNSPIGIDTIALSLSEDRKTIEEFIEPYLLQIGFIKKTPRGRVVATNGIDHLLQLRKEHKLIEKTD